MPPVPAPPPEPSPKRNEWGDPPTPEPVFVIVTPAWVGGQQVWKKCTFWVYHSLDATIPKVRSLQKKNPVRPYRVAECWRTYYRLIPTGKILTPTF